jgi:hypothetical protein
MKSPVEEALFALAVRKPAAEGVASLERECREDAGLRRRMKKFLGEGDRVWRAVQLRDYLIDFHVAFADPAGQALKSISVTLDREVRSRGRLITSAT